MLGMALKYAQRGWHVLPTQGIRSGKCTCGNPDCKSPGKHPIYQLVPNGLHGATTNQDIIKDWWRTHPWANVAIRTGKESGIFVVDVDKKEERGIFGDEEWESLVSKKCDKIDTLEAETGSGGRHIYFRYPADKKVRSGANVLGKGIDVRGDNGYVLAPPSVNVKGEYFWDGDDCPVVDAPDWLLDAITKEEDDLPAWLKPSTATANMTLPDSQVEEIESALSVIDPDDRDTWLQVGMALHSTNAGSQAYNIWTNWSRKSEKFDAKDQQKVWYSFKSDGLTLNTLFGMAKKKGWSMPLHIAVEKHTQAPFELSPVETAPTTYQPEIEAENPVSDVRILEKPVQKRYSQELPPGIIVDMVNYINSTSIYPQPLFALTSALSVCATTLGRKYMNHTRLRTNLYLTNLGHSGSGKEHGRAMVTKILTHAGLDSLCGAEEIASGQGLIAMLEKHPSMVLPIDELGKMIKKITAHNAGTHLQEITTNLMTLFSRTDSVYHGKAFADVDKTRKIPYPCVNIYACTTPDTFYEALGSSDVLSGFINRWIVVESDNHDPKRNRNISTPDTPQEILNWISRAHSPNVPGGNLIGVCPETPIEIPPTLQANRLLEDVEEYVRTKKIEARGTGLDALWVRVPEHIAKIAMVVALSRDIGKRQVEVSDVEWATEFVKYFNEQLLIHAEERIADNPFERDCKKVYGFIADVGKRGLTDRELNRKMKMKQRELREVLETLTAQEKVAFGEMKTSGRPRNAWVAIEQGETNA